MDPDPDPTPDPTPFFSDFKDANLPSGILSSVLKIKFFAKKVLFCKHYFSPLDTFMRKGKDPDPYLFISGSGSRMPKNIRIPNTKELRIIASCYVYCRWDNPAAAPGHQKLLRGRSCSPAALGSRAGTRLVTVFVPS
jgi:hypothetical protein